MSVASKVKLPSIAELTNHSRLPKASLDALPLLPIFKAPASRQLPLLDPLMPVHLLLLDVPHPPSYHAHGHPQPGAPLPSYQYYSSGPNAPPPPPGYYLHSYYHPMYYQLPVVAANNGGALNQPLPDSKSYSVAKVINKPMNKCHRCGTTETPEWRRGPNGLRTLCNACGLFHAKLVKRKGAALAAEEVLNNKVCKGKNGRRVSIKKQALDESKKRMREAQVTEIPPIPFTGGNPHPVAGSAPPPPPQHYALHPAPPPNVARGEYQYPVRHEHPHAHAPNVVAWGPGMALPPPMLGNVHQSLPPLRN